MSLTSQIRDGSSPVRSWFDQHLDERAALTLTRAANDRLAARSPLTIPGSSPMLAGAAFDYGFRWLLGPLEARVARAGADICYRRGWAAAPQIVDAVIERGSASADSQLRAQCCIVLAWFERVLREGEVPEELLPFTGAEEGPAVVDRLCAATPDAVAADVAQLLGTVPSVWGADLAGSFTANPTFAASGLIGGADADWIIDGILYECKCSGRARPFERRDLLQGIGYVLLDTYDVHEIRSLGWYYARQQERLIYPLPDLLRLLFGTADLPALRASFTKHLSPHVAPPPPWFRYAEKHAAPDLQSLLVTAVPEAQAAITQGRLVLTAIPTVGLQVLIAPEGRQAVPTSWCLTVEVQFGGGVVELVVVGGAAPTNLRWAQVASGPNPQEDGLTVTALPVPLTPDSAVAQALIETVRHGLS